MNEKPLVGILMGSDSDLPVMKDAAEVLESLGIGCEVSVLSAHRTPEEAGAYAKSAESRGLKVIIAGAGGAAHLAGVIAAHTPIPVIGVPIESKFLHGLDSLLSTAQMPSGVPVATVAVGGAKNAGILAAQIIGTGDAEVRKKVIAHKEKIRSDVVAKNEKLAALGYKKYLEK